MRTLFERFASIAVRMTAFRVAVRMTAFRFSMHNFVRNLLTEWRKLGLPFADETFIVAVSGGADSVSLLLALHELRKLKKLNLRFVIAHFNHDLRGAESAKDVEFVRDLTTKFNFEFVFRIQNPNSKIQNQSGNLEQNARIARYKFLTETAENLHAFGILTAHTQTDQAETFLLNLIRGSGLDGLGGMKPIRSQESRVESRESDEQSQIANCKSQILLVRPLLSWARREDTENFCRLNEVEFCSDPMNEDLAFKRVRIRKILLPMLQDFNPKIIETLANTASLLREDAEFLKATVKEAGSFSESKGQRTNDEGQPIKDLKNLFPSMRRQILRDWLKEQRGDLRTLEAKHFEAIDRLIFSRKSGKTVELPNGESIIKKDGRLKFQK